VTSPEFATVDDAVDFVYASMVAVGPLLRGLPDAARRRPDLWRRLADAVGAPDRRLRSVVVAGSKGKGSTSVLTASILGVASGPQPVGLVTSPHLLDYSERLRLDGQAVDGERLRQLIQEIAPAARALLAQSDARAYFSPVGYALLAGLLWFAGPGGARVAVLETGRGGRFDETSRAAHEVAVVTPIFREHVRELGPGLKDIARHKAGVIVPGVRRAVLGRQGPVAAEILEAEAQAVNCPAWRLGRDFAPHRVRELPAGVAFDLRTPSGRLLTDLRLRMAGKAQADNAACAVAAAEALLGPLAEEAIRRGLERVAWPGRLQELRPAGATGPAVLVDASIAGSAARRALAHARRFYPAPLMTVVAVPRAKDFAGVWREAERGSARIWLTRAQTPYLTFPVEESEAFASQAPGRRAYAPELDQALAQATAAGAGTIVCLGTLSFVAEVLGKFGVTLDRLWPGPGGAGPGRGPEGGAVAARGARSGDTVC
jgi:dihydrofolate synthase/folylpolyglutamate synthase